MSSLTSKVETITLLQLALLGVFSTWAFGGGAAWAVDVICLLGSLAPLLTIAAFRERLAAGSRDCKTLLLLLPLLGLNALVLLGTLQPSLRLTLIEGGQVFVPRADLSVWPSSARPELALRALWLFDAIILSCFNLLIAIRRRRSLRALLFVLATNALILAVFGSIQKFVNSPGLFFGYMPSPNLTFFASFIYHNHWGAYIALELAVCLGLLFSVQPWNGYRDFWHSPALAAVVAVFFLAVTIPLSGARACTALAILLLTTALLHGLRRVASHQNAHGRSAGVAAAVLGLTALVALVLVFLLARQSIETRVADTQAQVAHLRLEGGLGSRSQLYNDTWQMVRDKPWFGWGLGGYGTVFTFYNTQHAVDNLPQYYQYAHSDWLQLMAETGAVGTTLYLLILFVPLFLLGEMRRLSTMPRYLFAGCGLILLYACVEFPFGNPAVTLLFWTCFFCAVRWAQIDQRERTG